MDEAFKSRYKILETYSGGGGIVYKAIDRSFDRFVAIKTPDTRVLNSAEELQYFIDEGRLLAKFDHPNIIGVYNFHEVGELGEACYLVCPWMDTTLDMILASENLSATAVTDILLKVLEGVRAMHNAGIVHRDIKPGNIFLSQDRQQVKIGDLGIAADLDQDGTLDPAQLTPKYHAPEMFDESKTIGRRTDIYSLGMIAYEMFLGVQRFEEVFAGVYTDQENANTSIRWLNWHQDAGREAKPLSDFAPELDLNISHIVSLMLSKSIELRQPDVDTIINDFKELVGVTAPTLPYASLTGKGIEQKIPPIYKRRWFLVLAPVALVLWGGMGFFYLTYQPPQETRAIEMEIQMNLARAIANKLGVDEDDTKGLFSLGDEQRDAGASLFSSSDYSGAFGYFESALTSYRGSIDQMLSVKEQIIKNLKILIEGVSVETDETLKEGDKAQLRGAKLHKNKSYLEASEAFDTSIKAYTKSYTKAQVKGLLREIDSLLSKVNRIDNITTKNEYIEALALRKKGERWVQSESFESAIVTLVQSREQLVSLLGGLQQPVSVILGSSAEEISAAMELCHRSVSICDRAWYESEQQRTRMLKPFRLDLTEVSNREFIAFVEETNYISDAEKSGYSMKVIAGKTMKIQTLNWQSNLGERLEAFDEPVSNVSYNDAFAYCAFLKKRLPSADEWEFIARDSRSHTRYPWGDDWSPAKVAWLQTSSTGAQAVDSFEQGRTSKGHHHLIGNVWEWTSTRLEGGYVLKGGAWSESNLANLRPAAAMVAHQKHASDDYGFRCATTTERW